MGRRRGQRNAAREKVWPGQDAADVRAEKQGAVIQYGAEADCKSVAEGSVGSIPTSPTSLTAKELNKLQPASAVALAVRRATAEGTYALPPLIHKRSARKILKLKKEKITTEKRFTLRDTLGEFHWDNIGRAHYLILLLRATNHYALPQFMHDCDPEEIMMIAERMDLWKATVERMYRKAA